MFYNHKIKKLKRNDLNKISIYKSMTVNSEVDSEQIVVTCVEVSPMYSQFLIGTNDNTISTLLGKIHSNGREFNNQVFKHIYFSVMQYTVDELVKSAECEDQQKYKDWCDDVVLFYVYRFYLSEGKFRIPVVKGGLPENIVDYRKSQ
jgi:hypothetical protein